MTWRPAVGRSRWREWEAALWDGLIGALALPITLLLLPVAALERAVSDLDAVRRARASEREALLARKLTVTVVDAVEGEVLRAGKRHRLAREQAVTALAEALAAQAQLEAAFLRGDYQTPDEARRALRLLRLVQQRHLDQVQCLVGGTWAADQDIGHDDVTA